MAEIEIQDEGFVASGLQIVARNYLEGILFIKWLYFIIIINYKSLLLFIKKVYPYDRWSDRSLPLLSEGQLFNVSYNK